MAAIKSYLELVRISNLPTVWSNVVAAVVLSDGHFSWASFLLPALSLSLFYSGGMSLNDICDSRIDRLKRPSRPIPSGRISIFQASLFTALLFAAAFVALLAVSHRSALIAGALLCLFILAYDLFHKGNPLSVLLMAGCRLMVYVVTGHAVAGTLNSSLITIGMIQFGYIILVSLVARYENSRQDVFALPVISLMLAGICLVDGIYLAIVSSPFWLAAGLGAMLVTLCSQRYVRGD